MKKILITGMMLAGLSQAIAADTPTIKFIFALSAGSYSHSNLNIYKQCLSSQGANIQYEFKPGAGGLIAVKSFISDPLQDKVFPVLVSNTGMHFFAKYDGINLETDIVPLIAYTEEHIYIVTNPNGPKSLDDIKKIASVRPVTVGAATPTGVYLANTIFTKLSLPYTVVEYKAGPAALNDVLGGHVDMSVEVYPGVKSLLAANKLSVITSTNKNVQSALGTTIDKLVPKFGIPSMTLSVRPDAFQFNKDWLIKLMAVCNEDSTVNAELVTIGSKVRSPMLAGSDLSNYIRKYHAN